jgi:hypothetical protein
LRHIAKYLQSITIKERTGRVRIYVDTPEVKTRGRETGDKPEGIYERLKSLKRQISAVQVMVGVPSSRGAIADRLVGSAEG